METISAKCFIWLPLLSALWTKDIESQIADLEEHQSNPYQVLN